jgi:hypothetical protein
MSASPVRLPPAKGPQYPQSNFGHFEWNDEEIYSAVTVLRLLMGINTNI